MLYFDAANVISIVIVALSAICIFLSFDITRITSGAPRAWYIIISAFAILLVSRSFEAYYDVLTSGSNLDLEETVITLVVLILFVIGLYSLDTTFRKRFRVSQGNSSHDSQSQTS